MKYKQALQLIDEAVHNYKGTIDELAKDYRRKTAAVNAELNKISGDLTPEGQRKFKESRMPQSAEYTEKIREAQKRARVIVDYNLERVTAQLDKFFASKPNSDFVEHISAIALTGMVPSNREFEFLRKDAWCYAELRLLQSLGEQRTQKQREVRMTDPATAQTEYRETEVPRPFMVSLPDPDATYKALDSFKATAKGAIRFYSGENAELAELLPDLLNAGDGVMYSGLGTAFFRNNSTKTLTDVLDKVDAVIPKAQRKTELSEADKRFIAALIPEDEFARYPHMYLEQVRNVCEQDEGMRQLFALDPRFAETARKAGERE